MRSYRPPNKMVSQGSNPGNSGNHTIQLVLVEIGKELLQIVTELAEVREFFTKAGRFEAQISVCMGRLAGLQLPHKNPSIAKVRTLV
jgi:hypothetical protein